MLYYIILYHIIILYYIILCYIILYYIILYYIRLYYIISYHITIYIYIYIYIRLFHREFRPVLIPGFEHAQVTVFVRKRFPGSFNESQSVLENARRVLGLSNLSLVDEVHLDAMKTSALVSFGFRNVGELINEAIQLVAEKVVPRADAERFTAFFQNSLEQASDGIFLPPIFTFSPGLTTYVPYGSLGAEINVPADDLEEFVNQTVTSIHRGLQENPQPLILSLRFVAST